MLFREDYVMKGSGTGFEFSPYGARGLEPRHALADTAVLGILEPSFDTQCRPPIYSAGGIVLF